MDGMVYMDGLPIFEELTPDIVCNLSCNIFITSY